MPRRHLIALAARLVAAKVLSAVDLATAGSWPERVVRVLTPSAPGSSVDVAARVLAERLAERWRRPIVIDNRPGADGIIAVQSFLQAADDHTLLFAFPGVVTVVPLLHERLPYDPARDLVPISSVALDFLAVAVVSTLPVGSLDELVGLGKARPSPRT